MSYTPTTWATGDTVTAALLNKMEQGISDASSGGGGGGGSVLTVNVTEDENTPDLFVCDKTAGEMFLASVVVLFVNNATKNTVVIASNASGQYVFTDFDGNEYTAQNSTDYPSCDMS